MAKAILAFPEDALGEVLKVINAGLKEVEWEISYENREALRDWCAEQRAYLERDSG